MLFRSVVLSEGGGLFVSEITVSDINWISIPELSVSLDVSVRVRHSRAEAPARLSPCGDGLVKVSFPDPVRAPTPGQSAVFFTRDVVVGGGFIE